MSVKREPLLVEVPTTLQRVVAQVHEENLSEISAKLLKAGIADAKAGRVKVCDLSTSCPNCESKMEPEHAHYRCLKCGYRDSCCF